MTDDNCDNLTMAIAKDRRYLNEMIPNGLQTLPINENQHDSNISTSSNSTLYGPNGTNDYQTDIPFPRTHLSTDLIAFRSEVSVDAVSVIELTCPLPIYTDYTLLHTQSNVISKYYVIVKSINYPISLIFMRLCGNHSIMQECVIICIHIK